jgi:hypothetical protein
MANCNNKYIELLDRFYSGETSSEVAALLRPAMVNNQIADGQLAKYYGQKWDSADVHMYQALQQ